MSGDFGCGIIGGVIVIKIYCFCANLWDGGMRWRNCEVYARIVIYDEMQVYLRVVFCVDNPQLCLYSPHSKQHTFGQ